jgi:hypothetical protein
MSPRAPVRLHSPGTSLEAEMLRRHQLLPRTIAGLDHLADLPRRRGQRLLADHVLARVEGGDRQRRMVSAGCAHVDDVNVGVVDQFLGVGGEFRHVVFPPPRLQHVVADVAAADEFSVFGGQPPRNVGAGDSANPDDSHLYCCHTRQSFRSLVKFIRHPWHAIGPVRHSCKTRSLP